MEVFVSDWWWRSHQSLVHKSLRISRFCVMLWKKWARTHNQTFNGKTSWRGSNIHQNTEHWIQLMVSQRNSSGIFSRIQHVAAQPQSPRTTVKIERNTWNLQDGSSSCRCSTTSHGDQRTTRKNASQMLNSPLSLQKDSEQDNGRSSDLDQRKSGILSVKIVHKVNGSKWPEKMMVTLAESGHPVFRATSPLSRGVLKKQKVVEKLPIHYCADQEND